MCFSVICMRKKNKKKSKLIHIIKIVVVIFFSFVFFTMGLFFLWFSTIDLPSLDTFKDRKIAESTRIYDRTGEIILYDVHENIKRTVVSPDNISSYIKKATIAIEDGGFYNHHGIQPVSFLRAFIVNIFAGRFEQGGSTITQQVVKNVVLTPEKTISRKLKEWVFSLKLERMLSKEEILTLYLNEIPYGGNIYGVEEASRAFFGKSAKNLSLSESAFLASLPKAPTFYSPYGNNLDSLKYRKNLVLERMYHLGFITKEEQINAQKEVVVFLPQEVFGIEAPHFVMWVKETLEQKYGKDTIRNNGFRVITTIDYEMQQIAEGAVVYYGKINEEKFNANNAGMVVINPQNGHILAMVGSRDYFNIENEGNFNVTLGKRQPGSAFKPFVYASAFSEGYTPETTVFDVETQFHTMCDVFGVPISSEINPDDCYTPGNYDNIFRGPTTFRDALAQSINIPAIKALYLTGINDSLLMAQRLGITSLGNKNQYGLTLVLGGGEVSLLEMTSAYSVFANKGLRNPYSAIKRIEDRNGNVLEYFQKNEIRVVEKNVALQISDILSDNKARTPAFGAQSLLYFKERDVAVKTGTTNDYKDAWIIGYTPNLAVGAWVGNNDNSSMDKKVAGFIVAPMWNKFMKEALALVPKKSFEKPAYQDKENIKPVLRGIWKGGKTYYIDTISGNLATIHTPKELTEERIVTNIHNILHWVYKNNPNGKIPESPEDDPQYNLWEYPVSKWVIEQGFDQNEATEKPTIYDDVHKPEFFPSVSIVEPIFGSIFNKNERILVKIKTDGKFPINKVDFYINDLFIGSSRSYPFDFSFIPEKINTKKGLVDLVVVVYDSVLNKASQKIQFLIL